MRPVKLVMNAFGPYADSTEIDFDALGTSGVYLVCGDTGSGKTMIFDAICFALFGEASGDARGGARSTSSMRSDYADSSSRTFVELEFEYRGERYRVKRNPDYVRAKSRGEGETTQRADAEIELPDGRVITGVRKVNSAVVELLGIDSDQFKQIVMLAQGEFRKLLTSDTVTRESIFRKLFGTHAYVMLQDELGAQSNKLERENAKVKTQVLTLADRAVLPAGSPEAEEFDEVKAEDVRLGRWLHEALVRVLGVDEPRYRELDRRVEELRTKWSDANNVVKQVESRVAVEAEKRKIEGELSDLEESAPALAKAVEEQRDHDAERRAAVERAAQIEGSFHKYEEFQKAEEALALAHEEAQAAQRVEKDAVEAAGEVTSRLESLTAAAGRLNGADVRLERGKSELEESKRAADAARKLLDDAEKLASKEREADELAKKLDELAKVEDEARAACDGAIRVLTDAQMKKDSLDDAPAVLASRKAGYEEAERALAAAQALVDQRGLLATECEEARKPYEEAIGKLGKAEAAHDRDAAVLADLQKRQRAGRAGLLARELEEGMPCPVCGSLDHPDLAHEADEIPTDEAVDEAASKEARSNQEATELSVQAGRLKAVLQERVSRLDEFDARNGGDKGVRSTVTTASAALVAARAALDEARSRDGELSEAKGQLEKARAHRDETMGALEEARRERQAVKEALIAVRNAADAMREGLDGRDEASAKRQHEDALQRLEAAQKHFDEAECDAGELSRTLKELETVRAAEQAVRRELEAAREEARSKASAEALARERAAHVKSDLEFANLETAQVEALRLRQRSDELKASLDRAEKALRDNENACKTTRELLKAKAEQLAGIPDKDIDALHEEMEGYRTRAEALKREAEALKTRIDANRSCLEGLRSALDKAGDIEERYGRVKLLSDVATGNLSKKAKIRFEAYVQMIYFDKVIAAANQRLRVLTSGQFELVRHSDAAGNAKAGLGLYVIDSFTGRARDASSLSGGESFQASLCLALGLSDIVQAHAGGIEFDTMFVDEGFGSLDQAALGNAISLLSDLSGDAKLVGIISHVEELKANIPKKIVVTKTRSGSSASLEL